MLRRTLALAAVIVTALLLQSTVFSQIKLLGVRPELLYVVTISMAILEGPNEGAGAKFSDLNMLVMPGGRERSEAQFADLFAAAGLRLQRRLPALDGEWILEVVRA